MSIETMTRKRKLSNNEKINVNTCYQSCMRRARKHRNFQKLMNEKNVFELKVTSRKMGNKKWYSMRKKALASSIVVYNSVKKIHDFLMNIGEKKRKIFIQTREESECCPITLVKVSVLQDPYVHDGIVYSQKSLEEFFKSSFDFTNPITRRKFTRANIKRFGSLDLLETFDNKEELRQKHVQNTNHFSFLEMDIEDIMVTMLELHDRRASQEFDEYVQGFENTFERMKNMDKTRTLCTLEALLDKADLFGPKEMKWGKNFVDSFIKKMVV